MASSRCLLFVVAGILALAAVDVPAITQLHGEEKNADEKDDQSQSKAARSFGGISAGRSIPIVYGSNVAAILSPEGDRIWAYSAKYGKWQLQDIDLAGTPKETVAPILSSDLVALQTKMHVYAFSARTGQWNVLDPPQDAAVSLQVHSEWVSAEYGDTIALFSATKGRWSALNWKSGKVSD